MKKQSQEFFATCPKGFEPMLGHELAQLNIAQVRPLSGQVSFYGELADAYRACLWSRLASRIILVINRVSAQNADELYEGISHIDWSEHIPLGATITVEAHGSNDQLRNTHFTAVRTKDAIVDQLTARRGSRPLVNTRLADVIIAVRISKGRATIGIDLTGEPLFRRNAVSGRSTHNLAPLRPDYAAALLAAHGIYSGQALSDLPQLVFSGAGSLVGELAGIAYDRAPGLLRSAWGMSRWGGHDASSWKDVLSEAHARSKAAGEKPVRLEISDTRRGARTTACHLLRSIGLSVEPSFFSPAELAQRTGDAGVIADISWTGSEPAVQSEALSALAYLAGKKATVLALDATCDSALRQQSATVTPVIIGRTDACIRTYAASDKLEPAAEVSVCEKRVPVLVDASDQFAARLAKVAKLRAKWAKREDISCYRLYDADLPDYAVSIDLYQSCTSPDRWLQISEYAAPRTIDASLAKSRLLDVLAIAPAALDIPASHVSLRVRTRAKGGSQYSDAGSAADTTRAQSLLIDEGGLTFEVNFSQRLDCGIFLDHRQTRSMIREMMKTAGTAKSFLNLFAYTGTATCYAADGGALHTTTVDLSRPSLQWAKRNMARNGFDGSEHEFVQADVLAWIREQRHSKNRWNVIFCDVPTFSNSARMRKNSFDVQRDHAELIIGISRLLTRGGEALFSCNLRSFKLDAEKIERAGVSIEDCTQETIPEDFKRNQKIHHCYRVKRVR